MANCSGRLDRSLGEQRYTRLIFVLIVAHWKLDEQTSSIAGWAFYGALYATAIGLGTGGALIPITVNLMGAETIPEPLLPLPAPIGGLLVAVSVGVAHLVYGVLLGTIYGRVHPASRDGRPLVDRVVPRSQNGNRDNLS